MAERVIVIGSGFGGLAVAIRLAAHGFQVEVLEKRESKSRPNVGIVKVRTTGFKQDGKIVIEFLRTFMVYKRGHVPANARTRIPEPRRD